MFESSQSKLIESSVYRVAGCCEQTSETPHTAVPQKLYRYSLFSRNALFINNTFEISYIKGGDRTRNNLTSSIHPGYVIITPRRINLGGPFFAHPPSFDAGNEIFERFDEKYGN
jgi:hypothetical protein